MNETLQEINILRNIKHSDLAPLIRKVAIVLSSPRSGSSFIKAILQSHPEVASLTGEIEPFLVLTRNGFGFNSDSDAISVIANKSELIDNIFDDLTIYSNSLPSSSVLKKNWERRLLLQYPAFFANADGYAHLQESLDGLLSDDQLYDLNEKELQTKILTKLYEHEPWRINCYDGYVKYNSDNYFNELLKIEEPPFVLPRFNRREFTRDDALTKTLLFKTPPDVFRMGMYEELFPNAHIQYIHLTRGFAQVVNGLMDGWLSPQGFFSHNMKQRGETLEIQGYSDTLEFGKDWWKFDLPPNWREYKTSSLEDACLNQWASAQEKILDSKKPLLKISFEEFLTSPNVVVSKITQHLGLRSLELKNDLPIVMATEKPKKKRWEKRKDILLQMADRKEVHELMHALNYQMKPETWI